MRRTVIVTVWPVDRGAGTVNEYKPAESVVAPTLNDRIVTDTAARGVPASVVT
jgi:hypothetical protein